MNRDAVRDQLNAIKQVIRGGASQEAFQALCELADWEFDYPVQSRFAALYRSIDPASLTLTPIRIALLSSSTVEHFRDVLDWWLAREGFRAEFHIAEFDTIRQTVLNESGELYRFKPDIVWFFTSYRDIRLAVDRPQERAAIEGGIAQEVAEWSSLWDAVHRELSCLIIQNNADIPGVRLFGNYDASVCWTRASVLARFNLALAEALRPGVAIFDLESASSWYGKERWDEYRYWHHSKHAFSLDAYGFVAFRAARLIGAAKGGARKVLVLDLDNALWGGVIGDDGLDGIRLGSTPDGEAFVDFQRYVRALKGRGVVLAVCSKNEESTAREPFESHPEMVLRLEDISVFIANWRNKADNIREIAAKLNVGLDSLVFVDDNPAERALVRETLPEVHVIDLPEDPSGYLAALDKERLFETVAFTSEDLRRGDLYRENALRDTFRDSCMDLTNYLSGLAMESEYGDLDGFHLPRAAQLINKSNQFHVTTTRYTEAQLAEFMASPNWSVRYYRLKDRFGDNGLISTVILERKDESILRIDTWVMSCRVLARTMEEFICSDIVAMARSFGCRRLEGKYIPTRKNGLVEDLYRRMGFSLESEMKGETLWTLDLSRGAPHYATCVAPAAQQRVEAEST
ncbi:MAG: HAD-IIIC family phosphatase [Bacteroidota bacterium]|jgi:FkbH-like protein